MSSADLNSPLLLLCENILHLSTFTSRMSLLDLRFLFKLRPGPSFFTRLSFGSLKQFINISLTGCSGSLLIISLIILELVFKASLPMDLVPEYNRVLTKRESPEERMYTFTLPNPKTCPVKRTHLNATFALIYVGPSISIHCNLYTEF